MTRTSRWWSRRRRTTTKTPQYTTYTISLNFKQENPLLKTKPKKRFKKRELNNWKPQDFIPSKNEKLTANIYLTTTRTEKIQIILTN